MNTRQEARLASSWLAICVVVIATAMYVSQSHGQAVEGTVTAEDGAPPLTFHGLIPGLHTQKDVRQALGKPAFESKWYDYKLYYPAEGRDGLFDVIHVHDKKADSGLANIEVATVPDEMRSAGEIRAALGEPEYELRMATWRLLDYSEKGLRFATTPTGETIGVVYVPHGNRRVPEGERKLVDLSGLRQGAQPAPKQAASLNGLMVGVSEVIFSPTGKDWLDRPYKVHDDLKARTAIFRDGSITVALVGADLFGMGWKEVYVMREAAHEMGIDHMVLAMSHNHAAGDTIGVYGHYPVEYIAHIQEQVIEGLKLALDTLKPVAELRTASKELPMDGARVQGLFRNARNPGVLDPTISTIQAIGEDGEVITTLIHFACHVESLAKGPREISADFPGYMCEQIRKDGGGQPVFLNGAVGGMVSGDNRARTHASSEEMGLRLAGIVKDLVSTAVSSSEHAFSVDRRRIQIPMSNPNFKPLYESGLRTLNRGRVVSDMMYIRLGEAQLITIPGELLPEVSFEILEKMEGFPRMLIGLANDELGYLIPPYDYRDDYYEETMSQGPAAAVQVRDMALRMLSGR